MKNKLLLVLLIPVFLISCSWSDDFTYVAERFEDTNVLRYKIPGFDSLENKQKELLYYLYEAAQSGREMYWDQNYKHNLLIKRTFEAALTSYSGDKPDKDFVNFHNYLKNMWISHGIHHHSSKMKYKPKFSKEFLSSLINNVPNDKLPLRKGQTKKELTAKITHILFDPKVASINVNLDPKYDIIKTSSNNYYEGMTKAEVVAYYAAKKKSNEKTPVSHGLNTKLVKKNGKIFERVWRFGGMYHESIAEIIKWLEKAVTVAENDKQKVALEKLVNFYKTGDLKTFDEYSIAWVNDSDSAIDVVNGFIETYGDPLGIKGAFESVVSFRDEEASKRIQAIGNEAQWFEDNSPIKAEHKKKNVKGISAKVITVVTESGDAGPMSAIGINLPNSNWIRENHGSKSVTLGNIVHSYNQAKSKLMSEFMYTDEMDKLAEKYKAISNDLMVDMHEVIGHASGKINAGVGTPKVTLKNYAAALEEGRADLVALYYLFDPKLIDVGVMENLDVGKAAYDGFIINALQAQLRRLKLGDDIQESHMRNRQLIGNWAFEKGKADNVIEKKMKDGKSYFVINDYKKLRKLFGDLLKEIQRIKSEGDFAAGKHLIETYAVKVDQKMHKEVLDRVAKLDIPSYSAFLNPILVPEMKDGAVVDVKVEYAKSLTDQMLDYAKKYSFLPTEN